jgi:hypothetical protein
MAVVLEMKQKGCCGHHNHHTKKVFFNEGLESNDLLLTSLHGSLESSIEEIRRNCYSNRIPRFISIDPFS